MTLGVVIPVYRGKDTVDAVVEELYAFAKANHLPCRVVLVEDHGGDGSRKAVIAAAAHHGGVTCVLNGGNTGQQKATYLGLQQVLDCDAVATMDDDGEHPAGLLSEMLKKIKQGYDLCYAVPVRAGSPLFRRVGAALRDMLFSLCTKKPRGVKVSAYRVMTGELARKLAAEADGFIYLSAAAFRHKPRVACVYYEAPTSRRSSYTVKKLLRLYIGLLSHYTPLKIFRHQKRRQQDFPFTVLPGKGELWQP